MYVSLSYQSRYFYLLVSNGNLTLVFHSQLAAIKTDESVTLVYTVRINKNEANLLACPEKCWDISFLNPFTPKGSPFDK